MRRRECIRSSSALNRLGGCEGVRRGGKGLREGREGQGPPVMAGGAAAGMATGQGGPTELAAGGAGTPMTPASNLSYRLAPPFNTSFRSVISVNC